MSNGFYSSLNLDDEHVTEWLGQLDGDHPAKLRQAIRDAEIKNMADVFEFLVAEDERRAREHANSAPPPAPVDGQTAVVSSDGADVSTADGVHSMPTAPQAETLSPEPVVAKNASDGVASEKKKAGRTLRDVVLPYMKRIYDNGQYATAKELFKALEVSAPIEY